jgi:hypothetical protein
LSAVIGIVPVLQQTPRLITEEEPTSVMLPPLIAVVPVIFEIGLVVMKGTFLFYSQLK